MYIIHMWNIIIIIFSIIPNTIPLSQFECGKPWIPPALPLYPEIDQIELVVPGSWSWIVNICILEGFGQMDCKVLQGFILGNLHDVATRWILTAVNADMNPENLIVVSGATNYSDIINPEKVGTYLVRKIHTYQRPETAGLPELSLLELRHMIMMSEHTNLVPTCIPKFTRGHAKRFNNTASWVVGWVDNIMREKWVNSTKVQFYTTTIYAQTHVDKRMRFYVETRAPSEKILFFSGAAVSRINAEGRWFTFALSFWQVTEYVDYERTEFICAWIERITNKEVQCVPFS